VVWLHIVVVYASLADLLHRYPGFLRSETLAWKLRLRSGGMLLEVLEQHTTQTCSECGRLSSSRPRGVAGLGIREWTCDNSGAVHDRDVNRRKEHSPLWANSAC
jgi:hypothetical protein